MKLIFNLQSWTLLWSQWEQILTILWRKWCSWHGRDRQPLKVASVVVASLKGSKGLLQPAHNFISYIRAQFEWGRGGMQMQGKGPRKPGLKERDSYRSFTPVHLCTWNANLLHLKSTHPHNPSLNLAQHTCTNLYSSCVYVWHSTSNLMRRMTFSKTTNECPLTRSLLFCFS